MNGINKVILVGTLGKDPEVRYSSNGNAIANFSVATNESWKDKNTGQKVDKTEWHNIVMFGKVAEIAGEYLRKGSQVYLEGKLRTEKYQGKTTGEDKYSTKIECRDMQMLGGKSDNNQSQQQGQQQGGFQQTQQQGGYQQSPQQGGYQQQGTQGYGQSGPQSDPNGPPF